MWTRVPSSAGTIEGETQRARGGRKVWTSRTPVNTTLITQILATSTPPSAWSTTWTGERNLRHRRTKIRGGMGGGIHGHRLRRRKVRDRLAKQLDIQYWLASCRRQLSVTGFDQTRKLTNCHIRKRSSCWMCDNCQEPDTSWRPGPTPSACHEPGMLLPVSSLSHTHLNKTHGFRNSRVWGERGGREGEGSTF
jgi:hypothetical protein